jgi:hypothetical protein
MTWSLFGAIATAVSIPLGERVYQFLAFRSLRITMGRNIVRRIPRGYEDSTQAGSQAGLQDIKNNDMKFGVYGLSVSGYLDQVYAKYRLNAHVLWLHGFEKARLILLGGL